MIFKFKISKWANFYFFISNLSEWHFSCRKEYNTLWRKELGDFSSEEENALKSFKEIRSNYPSSKTFFEQSFFGEDEPWRKLEDNLASDKYKILKNIFDLFKNKFEVLYKNDFPFLEQWQKELEKKANERTLIENITKTLSVLYKTPIPEATVNVYLLFSSLNHSGGGANIDKKSISLEISRQPIKNINHTVGIIWHEVIHICFDKEYFHPLIRQILPKDENAWSLITETAASSLFPRGVLGVKLLNLHPPTANHSLHNRLPPKHTDVLLNLMQSYISQKKPLDENYIKEALLLINS